MSLFDYLEALFAKDADISTIPTSAVDDPLPEHEPDGYWSGFKGEKDSSLLYAEGAANVADMIVSNTRMKYPITFLTSKRWIINTPEEYHRYIEFVYCTGLIEGTDHYIRYQLANKPSSFDKLVGFFAVRCGDCGKVAAGEFKGNPNMGDEMYQVLHRKDYFCKKFGWTYCGGHGYSGGRRMICPECSKKYIGTELE